MSIYPPSYGPNYSWPTTPPLTREGSPTFEMTDPLTPRESVDAGAFNGSSHTQPSGSRIKTSIDAQGSISAQLIVPGGKSGEGGPTVQPSRLTLGRMEIDPLVGHPAPRFTLPMARSGELYTPPFGEKPIVILFLPWPTNVLCTRQACIFRDEKGNNAVFQRHANLEVIAISSDSFEVQTAWSDKLHVDFPVLSDHNSLVHSRYGVTGNPFFLNLLRHRKSVFIGSDGVVKSTMVAEIMVRKHFAFVETSLKEFEDDEMLEEHDMSAEDIMAIMGDLPPSHARYGEPIVAYNVEEEFLDHAHPHQQQTQLAFTIDQDGHPMDVTGYNLGESPAAKFLAGRRRRRMLRRANSGDQDNYAHRQSVPRDADAESIDQMSLGSHSVAH